MKNKKNISVILMTYGSPETPDMIPAYLKNVYHGIEPNAWIIDEFRRRYKLIGGSPLLRITREQAADLEKLLNKNSDEKIFIVVVGMRFAPPFIPDVVSSISKQTDMIVGLIMSPQYSPIIMSGYVNTLTQAVEKLNNKNVPLKIATDWHMQGYFLQSIAEKIQHALETLPTDIQKKIPILFTAHSMPKRIIEKEPNYIHDLKETASGVARILKLNANRWQFCYQSAGHTPEEWLKPDFADIMPRLKATGQTHVLIAPIQFLADHLEILYDIDIAARKQAEDHGLQFIRTQSLNTAPLFIKALAKVVNMNV